MLLFIIAITFSANCVNAESVITMDNLKNQLEESSIIKGYNATLTIEGKGRLLYIETDDLQVSFSYIDGTLKYSGLDPNMSIYLLDQTSMTKEEFVKRSQENTNIVSEVVACVADLYGYTGYHNDWIGHILPNDYENKGITYSFGSVNEVAFVSILKLNLNGPFEATLVEQSLNKNGYNLIIQDATNQDVTQVDLNNQGTQENIINQESTVENPNTSIYQNCCYIVVANFAVIGFYFVCQKNFLVK